MESNELGDLSSIHPTHTSDRQQTVQFHANPLRLPLIFPHTLVGSRVAHDVEQQRVGGEVYAVVRSCDGGSNILSGGDTTQLNETGIVLHSLTDQTSRSGFSLCANDGGFLVLLRLLHHILGTLGLLLGDLLGFDGVGELASEGQIDNGHIIDDDSELATALDQVTLDQTAHLLSLRQKGRGVELGNHLLQHFVHNGRHHTLVPVYTHTLPSHRLRPNSLYVLGSTSTEG